MQTKSSHSQESDASEVPSEPSLPSTPASTTAPPKVKTTVMWSKGLTALGETTAEYFEDKRKEWETEKPGRAKLVEKGQKMMRSFSEEMSKHDLLDKTKSELTDVVNSLMLPEDPPIKLVIQANPFNTDTQFIVAGDKPPELWIGLGTLAFAKNVNELAGIISFQMAQMRGAYEKSLGQKLLVTKFKDSKNPSVDLKAELDHLDKEKRLGNPVDAAYYENIRNALNISRMNDSFQKRADIEKQMLRQMRMGVDVSDATKQRIVSAKLAIDRMIVAGYDPWGGLSARKKMAKTQENPDGIKDHLKRMFFMNTASETTNSEMEFVQNYLLYTENKKIDLEKQPFKGQPLAIRLRTLHAMSTAAQMATLQGVAKYYLGLGSIGTGGFYTFYRMMNRDSEPKTPKEQHESKSSSSLYAKIVLGTYGALMGSAVTWGLEPAIRGAIFNFQKAYQKYFGRYGKHLTQEKALEDRLEALSDPKQKALSVDDVKGLLEDYRKASIFMNDGIDPDLKKIGARERYMDVYEAPVISLYRLNNRAARKSLFGDPGVKALMEGYEKEAEEELKAMNYRPDAPIPKSKIKKLAKKKAKADIYSEDVDLWRDKKISSFSAGLGAVRQDALSYRSQRWLYGLTGLLSEATVSKNSTRLTEYLDKYLSDPDLKESDRKDIIDKFIELKAMQNVNPSAREDMLALIEKHYPDKSYLHKSVAELVRDKKNIPKSYFTTAMLYKAGSDLSPQDLHDVLEELVGQARYVQAAKVLLANMDRYSEYRGPDAYELMADITQRAARDVANPVVRRSLVNGLIARSMFSLNQEQKISLWSQLGSSFSNPVTKGLLNPLAELNLLMFAKAEDMRDFLEKLALLRDTGTSRSLLSDLLIDGLHRYPLDLGSIDEILDNREFWRGFVDPNGTVKSNVEWMIIKKYMKLGEKYPAFTYDPRRSEETQKILMRSYLKLKPDATYEEKAELWKRMASRGATGVTDTLFSDIFDNMKNPEARKSLAEAAMQDHLLWSKPILTRAFREVNADKYQPHYLETQGKVERESFLANLKAFPATGDEKQRREATTDLLKDFSKQFYFENDPKEMQKKEFLKRLGSLALSDKSPASRLTDVQKYFADNDQNLKDASEFGVLERESKTMIDAFSDAGSALVDTLDWFGKSVQAKQKHVFYTKTKMIELDGNKEDDLAYSAMNTLVETAVRWSPEEKWQVVRWLRGSAEPPPKVSSLFSNIGPESVRRLYLSMPTVFRMGFVNPLINSAKNSLLTGRFKPVFYQQILAELLPEQKQSAEVAKELLSAFLFAVEKAGNPEKKMAVLSYLLANHSEGESSSGKVLRNVLESYGVVGVKLGQLMAASDLLPEDLRKELSQLRDGANPPKLFEIYEQLQDVLGVKNVEAHFRIKKLLGSASVKYAILVEDNEGKEHVIQIKRPEADVALNKDLKQLDLMVDYLIGSNKRRYAYLKGLAGATKDAIIRELSLVRESQKTVIAKAQYESLPYPDDVKVHVPEKTDLIDNFPGKKTRVHFARSSVFVEGRPIDQFPQDVQKKMAKVILDTEYSLYFTEHPDGAHIDPDRHPGNILLENHEGSIEFEPIDWGQLLELKPTDRDRIYRMMAYAQIMEVSGPQKKLVKSLVDEFKLDPKSAGRVEKSLFDYFPNQEKSSRSALGGYYYLLSVLENHGLDKKLIHYDFIKGIYQLEAYEELLRGDPHQSPKERFAQEVESQAKALAKDITPNQQEKIAFALRHPDKALSAIANLKTYESGQTELRDWSAFLKLSPKATEHFSENYDPKIKTAEEFVLWLGKNLQKDNKEVPEEDRARIEKWIQRPELDHLNYEHLSVKDFVRVATTSTIQRKLDDGPVEKGKTIDSPPIPVNRFQGVGEMYGAELGNAIFWSIWDHDPRTASAWLDQFFSLQKHMSFMTFSVAQNVWNNTVTRGIPMSLSRARYFSEHGMSMAVGTIAADIVMRLKSGQKFDDVIAHVLSGSNLRAVGASTAAYMAASELVERATALATRRSPAARDALCRKWYGRLAKQTLTFIVSDGIQRVIDPKLEKIGFLKPNDMRKLKEEAAPFQDRIKKLEDAINTDIKNKDKCSYFKHAYGLTDDSSIRQDDLVVEFNDYRGLGPESLKGTLRTFGTFTQGAAQSSDPAMRAWSDNQKSIIDDSRYVTDYRTNFRRIASYNDNGMGSGNGDDVINDLIECFPNANTAGVR